MLTLVMHIGRGTTRYELDENNSGEERLIYAPEQRSGRDSTGTTERACWHENTTIFKEQIICGD